MTNENTHQDEVVIAELEEADVGETHVQVKGEPVSWMNLATAGDMRAHIFSVPDIKEEIVEVPEWGVKILVRGMKAGDRSRVMQSALNPDGTPNLVKMYPDLVIASAFHPTENMPIFTPADRDALNEKAGGVLERLALAATRLSGLDQAQVSEIRKN